MSRSQSFQRCKTCNAITSLSHRCQQRPQAKMRGETKGLTTGSQWTANDWAAHLRAKVETGAKATEKPRVLVGDVWRWNSSGNDYAVERITGANECELSNDGNTFPYRVDFLMQYATLVSRAQKAERAPNEFRKGDRVRQRSFGAFVLGTVVDTPSHWQPITGDFVAVLMDDTKQYPVAQRCERGWLELIGAGEG